VSERCPIMGVKTILYSVWCWAKFVVAFSIILAVAVPRQGEIQGIYNNVTCWECYNRSLVETGTLFEFGVCNDQYVHQGGSNLMINKGYWDTSTDPSSTVKTYIWLSALLFVLGFIGASMFLFLGYLAKDIEDSESLPLLVSFVKINFYVSVGVMMLANSIWNLYLSDGCWVSPVSKSYIVGQSVLLYMYIGFALMDGFCKGGMKLCMTIMATIILFGYALLSIIISSITFQHSRDPHSIILVVLAFASIFEVPFGLFGFTIVSSFLQRVGINRQLAFPL